MATVPITVLFYDGPLLCGFNTAIKGCKKVFEVRHLHECRHRRMWSDDCIHKCCGRRRATRISPSEANPGVAGDSMQGDEMVMNTTRKMTSWVEPELSMSWVDPRVGLGRVGSRFCSFRWVGLGWVEYDKNTIFLMITQHAWAYQLSCLVVVVKKISCSPYRVGLGWVGLGPCFFRFAMG